MEHNDNIFDDEIWNDFDCHEFIIPSGLEEKPQKLTDGELLKKIRTRMVALVSRCASRSSGFDQQDLWAIVDREIIRNQEHFYGLDVEEYRYKERYDEEMKLRERLRPALLEMIDEVSFIGQKKRSLFIINRSIAEAAVSKLLEGTGYDFYIRYNLNHAKVHIKLTKQKKAVLYLKYDKLKEQLPKVIGTLEAYKDVYRTFGAGSGVISLYKYDDGTFEQARQDREDMK